MAMRFVTNNVYVCVSVCPARDLTFESLDLETSFLVYAVTSSDYLSHVRVSMSSGEGQGHGIKNGI